MADWTVWVAVPVTADDVTIGTAVKTVPAGAADLTMIVFWVCWPSSGLGSWGG